MAQRTVPKRERKTVRPTVSRTRRCPICSGLMRRRSDHWGPYYVCEHCGYATEETGLEGMVWTPPRGSQGEESGDGDAPFEQ
jgi:hypothetical protein